MIAVDTNLLVYAHRAGVPQHRAARRALERAASDDAGWGIALASIAEFWSVTTHPGSAGGPSTPAQASGFLQALVATGGAQLWQPGSGFSERFLALAVERRIQGPRIFDLQIGLTALESGAREIWTDDRQFLTLPGLRVRNPLD